jgi:hypothetical protein
MCISSEQPSFQLPDQDIAFVGLRAERDANNPPVHGASQRPATLKPVGFIGGLGFILDRYTWLKQIPGFLGVASVDHDAHSEAREVVCKGNDAAQILVRDVADDSICFQHRLDHYGLSERCRSKYFDEIGHDAQS